MEKNKTEKYFKYAIGEIILVVIGILIALNINTLNNNRIERIKERNLLNNLHADFLLNKVQFDSTKTIHQDQLRRYHKIISYFPIENYSTFNDTLWKYEKDIRFRSFNPASGTVNAIINSGNLNIIQNDTLQEYLTKWIDVLNDYIEEENVYIRFLTNLTTPYMLKEADLLNNNKLTESTSLREYQNMILHQIFLINQVIEAQTKEPIENCIEEIIRLSKPEK